MAASGTAARCTVGPNSEGRTETSGERRSVGTVPGIDARRAYSNSLVGGCSASGSARSGQLSRRPPDACWPCSMRLAVRTGRTSAADSPRLLVEVGDWDSVYLRELFQLDRVHASLAYLRLPDISLALAQTPRGLGLRQPGAFARSPQAAQKSRVFRSSASHARERPAESATTPKWSSLGAAWRRLASTSRLVRVGPSFASSSGSTARRSFSRRNERPRTRCSRQFLHARLLSASTFPSVGRRHLSTRSPHITGSRLGPAQWGTSGACSFARRTVSCGARLDARHSAWPPIGLPGPQSVPHACCLDFRDVEDKIALEREGPWWRYIRPAHSSVGPIRTLTTRGLGELSRYALQRRCFSARGCDTATARQRSYTKRTRIASMRSSARSSRGLTPRDSAKLDSCRGRRSRAGRGVDRPTDAWQPRPASVELAGERGGVASTLELGSVRIRG